MTLTSARLPLSVPVVALGVAALLPSFWSPLAALFVAGVVSYGLAAAAGRERAQRLLLLLLIVGGVGLGLGDKMVRRHAEGRETNVHDGAIHVEEAARFLRQGKNPYQESYHETIMAQWPAWPGDNPALDLLPYLPALILPVVPLQALFEGAVGWFDVRLWYGLHFVGMLLALAALARQGEAQQVALALGGLNPLLVAHVVEGRNDVVALAWLAGAAVAWQHGRTGAAALSVGVVLALKQTTWLFLPFALLLGWQEPQRRRLALLALLPLVGTALPFLLWQPAPFVEGVLIFQSRIYPIQGWGLSHLLLALGLVQPQSATIFTLLQAAVGLPLLAWLGRRQWRANHLAAALWHGTLLSLAIFYVARAFQDNYLGFLAGCLVLAWAASTKQPTTEQSATDDGL